jgi:hypothetical protein
MFNKTTDDLEKKSLKKMDFTCPNGQVGQKVNVEP